MMLVRSSTAFMSGIVKDVKTNADAFSTTVIVHINAFSNNISIQMHVMIARMTAINKHTAMSKNPRHSAVDKDSRFDSFLVLRKESKQFTV